MSDIAIKVENLSKSYRIRKGKGKGYTALRDVMAERIGLFFSNIAKGKNPFQSTGDSEIIWALDDISFEVKQGEVLGVIGRNGAGKSTLLKLLSRITEPDKGKITLNGRVSSLLEVGTGFHPELTGRENIYLSGAILGMRKEEINRRFDEIVDFAGIEQFLDTPVKRYSSGMYVRLGFAVAAHLETEIILLDEILTVGDSSFRSRSIKKLTDISRNGKTILFVSHDFGSIRRLSTNCLSLEGGKVEMYSDVEKCLSSYLSKIRFESADNKILNRISTTSSVWVSEIYFRDPINGSKIIEIISGQKVEIIIGYQSSFVENTIIEDLHIGISIFNLEKGFVTVLNNNMSGFTFNKVIKNGFVKCIIDSFPIMFGDYYCTIKMLVNGEVVDAIDNICEFKVIEGDYYNSGFNNCFQRTGIYINQKWQIGDIN